MYLFELGHLELQLSGTVLRVLQSGLEPFNAIVILNLFLQLACARLRPARSLQVVEFALELQHELLELLELHAPLLDLDLQVDVLLERGIDLVWGELSKALLEEVHLQLDVEVLLLERIDVLHCVQCSEGTMTRFDMLQRCIIITGTNGPRG